jgi:RasGEF N-terminal motif
MLCKSAKLFDILGDVTKEMDEQFVTLFLLTYRSSISPDVFLENLVARFYCRVPENATSDEIKFFSVNEIAQKNRTLSILEKWLTNHYHDFALDIKLRSKLKWFLEAVLKDDKSIFSLKASTLMSLAVKRVRKL